MENTVSLPKQNVKRTDRAWRTWFHCQNRMLKELTEHGEHGFLAKIECLKELTEHGEHGFIAKIEC